MSTLTFDKLSFVDKLKAGGVSDEQARIHAEALEVALNETVATKSDLRDLEMRMVKWLIPLLLGQAALVAALVKLL